MKNYIKLIIAVLCLTVAVFCTVNMSLTMAAYDSDDFFGQPSVLLRLDDADALASLNGTQLPASVIMRVNSGLNVEGVNKPVSEVYSGRVKDECIAVFEPIDVDALTAVKAYVEAKSIKDAAILSDDVLVLGQAYSSDTKVFFKTGVLSNEAAWADAMTRAALYFATVIVLPAEQLTLENVYYMQARAVSVFVETDGSKVQIADAVGSGAYGIITPEVQPVFEVYDLVNDGASEQARRGGRPRALSRTPFIIAHRGDTTFGAAYNSIAAMESAEAMGATHVEIDIRKTLDDEIILLHDESVQYDMRNADGTPASGMSSQMTLAQLKELYLTDMTSRIATIDEFFEFMEEAPDIIALIEIKGRETQLMSLLAAKVEQYDMANRIVVISFYQEQLILSQQLMPTIPTAILLWTSIPSQAFALAKSARSAISMDFMGNYTDGNLVDKYGGESAYDSFNNAFRSFADRGYGLWLWTFNMDSMEEALGYAVTGITTDDVYTASERIQRFAFGDAIEVDAIPQNNDVIAVKAYNYKNEEMDISVKVKYVSEDKAILIYEPEGENGLVSMTVSFTEKSSADSGCSCGGDTSMAIIGIISLMGGTVAIIKRRTV